MVIPRRKKYRPWNPQAYALQAFSPADRLPEGDLVFFLLDVIPQLDLQLHPGEERGRGMEDEAVHAGIEAVGQAGPAVRVRLRLPDEHVPEP